MSSKRGPLLLAVVLLAALAAVAARAGKNPAMEIKVYDALKKEKVSVPRVELTDEEWKKKLDPESYAVLRGRGTERAFTGRLTPNKAEGIYICNGCGNHLFSSADKYESGTGWPSFTRPVDEANIGTELDKGFFMTRVEVHCARCGGHLGHVFDDGPAPTGKRYCMNSVSLDFVPAK